MNTTTNFGPIGQDVYDRTYSRLKRDGTRETWPDTVDRVVVGNLSMAPLSVSIQEAVSLERMMLDFEVIPAGRHLWVTGVEGIPGEARRNCYVASWGHNRLGEHFEFTGSMLLLGGGVGANYSSDILERFPLVRPFNLTVAICDNHPDVEKVRAIEGVSQSYPPSSVLASKNVYYIVDDSREGWVAAWGALFDAAESGDNLTINLTEVRPSGSPIKTFGGTASGPAALAQSIMDIYKVLTEAATKNFGYFTGIHAMDADHAIASAVVAGGTRRSARMSMMHWRDPLIFEFITSKSDPMRNWTTNISIEIDEEFHKARTAGDEHAVAVFNAAVDGMYLNGEPGFADTDAGSKGERTKLRATNPCGENFLEEGESCNIGSVNLDAIGTDDKKALYAFELMTRFLLRQTLSPLTIEPTKTVENENRRIGVGFLGLQGWAAAHGVKYSDIPHSTVLEDKLIMFADHIRETAHSYARELGINAPIKVTAIAPNGTIAQLPGTQPGAHAILMRQGIRNVRYRTDSSQIDEAFANGYPIEPCLYSADTMVVGYPLIDPLVQRFPEKGLIESVDEVSVIDQFAVLEFVTKNFCDEFTGNAVSYTASFNPDVVSRDELAIAVAKTLHNVKGLTAFPTQSRPQMPYTPLSEEEFEALFNGSIDADGDTGDEELTCSISGGCPIR
jgi:ribonucleoside-triphosphate reductase (thioredoxin)